MIAHLKTSRLGKRLYRLSHHRLLGAPLRWLSRRGAFEVMDAAHLKPENRRHNAAQTRTLAQFRAGHRQTRR
jgi:hypothetical protein